MLDDLDPMLAAFSGMEMENMTRRLALPRHGAAPRTPSISSISS